MVWWYCWILASFFAICTAGASCQDVSTSEDEECQAAQFLQTATHMRSENQACGHLIPASVGDPTTFFNNNCRYHTHGSDCNRPIQDVMAEHPGMDGFCYFNGSAMYIFVREDYSEPNFEASAVSGILGLRTPDYKGLDSGPEVTYRFEGETIFSHMDVMHYIYDDLYAYSLGALQGQGLDVGLIKNSTAWIAVSESKCHELQAKYHFTREDMVFSDVLDMNMPLLAMSLCAGSQELPENLRVPYVTEKANYHNSTSCQPPSRREYARHHYMKCLLGYTHSADDLAYLATRACLMEGNKIRHFGECPYQPLLLRAASPGDFSEQAAGIQ